MLNQYNWHCLSLLFVLERLIMKHTCKFMSEVTDVVDDDEVPVSDCSAVDHMLFYGC